MMSIFGLGRGLSFMVDSFSVWSARRKGWFDGVDSAFPRHREVAFDVTATTAQAGASIEEMRTSFLFTDS